MFHKRLDHFFTQKVMTDAVRDWNAGTLERTINTSVLSMVISAIVLIVPVLIGGLGVIVIAAGWGSITRISFGCFLLLLAFVTRPRVYKPIDRLVEKTTLPKTGALLDRLSQELGASPITHLHFYEQPNAFLSSTHPVFGRRQHVLGIGFMLWDRLGRREKLALLAHEIAHLANNDPARGRLQHKAISSLAYWYSIFSNDNEDVDAFEMVFAAIYSAIAWGIERLALGILRATHLSSQRAEYFADALAARTVGRTPVIALLNGFAIETRLDSQVQTYHPFGRKDHDGSGIFRHFADLFKQIPQQASIDALAEDRKESASVDATHPPTWMRTDFLKSISLDDDTTFDISDDDMMQIDAELETYRAREGKRLFGYYIDATT